MIGFNAGINISLGDIELALDYLQDGDICESDLIAVKSDNKENIIEDKILEPAYAGNIADADEEDEDDLDFGDESDDYENDEDSEDDDLDMDDIDFEDEDDEDLDFGDEEEGEFEDDEDLDEFEDDEDLDFGDEEEYEEDSEVDDDLDELFDDEEEENQVVRKDVVKENVVKQESKVIEPTTVKSAREIELEKRLLELEVLAKEKKLMEEREASRQRELELERKLAEAEKLLEGGVKNESNQKVTQNRNATVNSASDNIRNNSSAKERELLQQKQRLARERQLQALQEKKLKEIDYSNLEIDALWKEVRRFMIEQGVQSKLVHKSVVENKFGASNIKKLYLKGYLIPFGSKLTIGK